MWQYSLKILLSALMLVIIAETAKRSVLWGAMIASLPLTSLLAFVWLYVDTGNLEKISALSMGIFWLVLPSLILFITLPLFLRSGLGFWVSLFFACLSTSGAYFITVKVVMFFNPS